MKNFINNIIDEGLTLLFPKRCVACDKVLLKIEKEKGFCKDCATRVRLVGKNYCLTCGSPIREATKEFCQTCQETKHNFETNRGVFRYEGNMKDSIYRFKYSNRRCNGVVYAKHAYKTYGEWLKQIDVDAIVPVPMYKAKERRRGYNQAEVFARELGELANIPVRTDLVTRNNDTEAMKGLNRVKRKKNLLKAFTSTRNVVGFKRVLVVDDIYTTGTTMDEVAGGLKSGGVQQVYGLCVCIGQIQ